MSKPKESVISDEKQTSSAVKSDETDLKSEEVEEKVEKIEDKRDDAPAKLIENLILPSSTDVESAKSIKIDGLDESHVKEQPIETKKPAYKPIGRSLLLADKIESPPKDIKSDDKILDTPVSSTLEMENRPSNFSLFTDSQESEKSTSSLDNKVLDFTDKIYVPEKLDKITKRDKSLSKSLKDKISKGLPEKQEKPTSQLQDSFEDNALSEEEPYSTISKPDYFVDKQSQPIGSDEFESVLSRPTEDITESPDEQTTDLRELSKIPSDTNVVTKDEDSKSMAGFTKAAELPIEKDKKGF